MIGLGSNAQETDPFVTVWKTDNAGVSASDQIRLPIYGPTGTGYDFWVYWGDGTYNRITAYNDAARTHTYPAPGTYTVRIEGKEFRGFRFANGGDRLKLLEIKNWGRCFRFGNSSDSYFYGCENLTISATDVPNTAGLTSLLYMFGDCSSLANVPNFGKWRMGNVTEMRRVFSSCNLFNADIGDWDVSKVTRFEQMFSTAPAFNNGGSPSINNWNTAAAWDFSYMFRGASAFNQPIGNWNVGNATNMGLMFNVATAFNQNIGAWNVGKVTSMQQMFSGATAFNNGGSPDINNWDVSKVQSFSNFMNGADAFNQPIGNWNTGAVTNMGTMFGGTEAFNQPIGNWDVSKVTTFASMFQGPGVGQSCPFEQDIGAWNPAALTTAAQMFLYTTLNTVNYDALLIGWAAKTLLPGVIFHGGNSKYTKAPSPAATARAYIAATYGWTIADGGPTP